MNFREGRRRAGVFLDTQGGLVPGILAWQSSIPPGLRGKSLGTLKNTFEWYGLVMGTGATGIQGVPHSRGGLFAVTS